MNRILRFLRTLDKRRLIFILQRACAILGLIRPYPECGQGKCPCPVMRKNSIQGIAIGGKSASVEINESRP